MQEFEHPILIYHNFRGRAQPIRHLCGYLGVNLSSIIYEQYVANPEVYPQWLKPHFVNLSIESLPELIHQGMVLNDLYSILAYLCRRYGRLDLLGSDIHSRVRLQQITSKWIVKFKNKLMLLFQMNEQLSTQINQDAVKRKKRQTYQKILTVSQFIVQTSKLLSMKPQKQFIFGSLTILDFLYYESCFYLVGIFGELSQKLACPINRLLTSLFAKDTGEISTLSHIDIMKNFKKNFQSLPFYQANKNHFQSYCINCPMMSPTNAASMKKLWGGDKKFFSI